MRRVLMMLFVFVWVLLLVVACAPTRSDTVRERGELVLICPIHYPYLAVFRWEGRLWLVREYEAYKIEGDDPTIACGV